MKKRVVTEDQYPIMKGVARYLVEEEKIIRLEAYRKWRDSNLYTASDFPKKRYYVVLARNKKSGRIYGFNDEYQKPLSTHRLLVFTTTKYAYSNKPFSLKHLRSYRYSGHNTAKHTAERLRGMNGSEKFEVFIARVGSKNCPIKVKLKPRLKNQVRAAFVTK